MKKLICFQFARELGNATDALLISSAPGGQQAAASSFLSAEFPLLEVKRDRGKLILFWRQSVFVYAFHNAFGLLKLFKHDFLIYLRSPIFFLCCFTLAVSLSQGNPNDSSLAIFIAALGLSPSHRGC